MFAAVQSGDTLVANQCRNQMEDLRRQAVSTRQLPDFRVESLPIFSRQILNQNQQDLGIEHRSNCINAAFNFHSEKPSFQPYSTMEFLTSIRSDFQQFGSSDDLEFGDLVVFWSRVSDEWKNKNILVSALDPAAPGFPFGIVFDHVAVFVGAECLFHKPDPSMDSRYQVNHWADVVEFSRVVDGFEMTFHRKILCSVRD